VPRHPSQLYEAALEGLLLFVVIRVATTRGLLRHPGAATGLFLAGYGLARFLVEFFREPDAYAATLGFLTRGMLLSLPMAAIGAFLIVRALRKPAPAPEAEDDAEGLPA
jgi:phosphatidylglycerol:prolipoprotein diacylglycerol transferase